MRVFSHPTRDIETTLHDGAEITSTQVGQIASVDEEHDFHNSRQSDKTKLNIILQDDSTVSMVISFQLSDGVAAFATRIDIPIPATAKRGLISQHGIDNVLFDEEQDTQTLGRVNITLGGAGSVFPLIFLSNA